MSEAYRGGGSVEVLPNGSSTVQSMAAVFAFDPKPSLPSLSWLVDDMSNSLSAVVFGEDPTNNLLYRTSNLPQNHKMMSCLGLLSDVIVVVLASDSEKTFEVLNDLEQMLQDIAHARQARHISKGKLVVVSEAAQDPWWVQEVVQRRLGMVTPDLWETFDVMTPETLKQQWMHGNILDSSSRNIASLLPYKENVEALSLLIEKVYISLGGWFENLDTMPIHLQEVARSGVTSHESSEEVSKNIEVLKDDPQEHMQKVLTEAREKLAALESKMQEVQLENLSSNQMPMLDFGGQTGTILEETYTELGQFPPSVRSSLMNRLVLEVHTLYKDHLQSLRDYYGRRYELCLEQEEDEATWATEAEHMTQAFQAAAEHAVPPFCREGAPLSGIVSFDSINILQGLTHDMLEATQLRKDEQNLGFDEADLEDLSPRRRRIPKWTKKIVSRALALCINYLQGWLAWQGIKRAALERDREMPKFPLF